MHFFFFFFFFSNKISNLNKNPNFTLNKTHPKFFYKMCGILMRRHRRMALAVVTDG
jgi:hypothetical protein